MKLFQRRDEHARFRQMLSAQLDVPLHLDEAWQLNVHLSRCESCRAAEREYREQRRALRGLPERLAPRDLWARTSAALDREMSRPWRSAGRSQPAAVRSGRRRRSGRRGSNASVAVSLLVLAAAGVVAVSQLPLLDESEPTRLRATPFAVPGRALAYLGGGPDGFSIYTTHIDHVCPVGATDCVEQPAPPSALKLPHAFEPSRLVLSPSGRALVVTGRDGDRDSVVAIVVMPEPDLVPTRPAPPPPIGDSPPPTLVATARPPASASATPSTTPLVTAATTASPAPALTVLAILEDAIGVGAPPAWSGDGEMLAFSAMPSDGSRGPDIYVWQHGETQARRLTHDEQSYFASWTGARIVASRVAAEDGVPVATTVVIDPATGEERAVERASLWLPQVNGQASHAVAWQGTLAWHDNAVAPDSGALFLVEWATLDPFADESPAEPPPPDEAPPAEPTAEPTAEPDPVASIPPRGPDEPTNEPDETERPRRTPAATATPLLLTLPPRDRSPEPSGRAVPTDQSSPTDEPTSAPTAAATPPEDVPAASAAPPSALPAPQPGRSPAANDDGAVPQAIEPGRDALDEPVRDWEVDWSPDGALLGFWTADAPGSSWGQLAVVALDPETGMLQLDNPLLPATLARRTFAVSTDRVAWVAPVEGSPEGELRVTTWGPDGRGVLRLVVPDVEGAVSPF